MSYRVFAPANYFQSFWTIKVGLRLNHIKTNLNLQKNCFFLENKIKKTFVGNNYFLIENFTQTCVKWCKTLKQRYLAHQSCYFTWDAKSEVMSIWTALKRIFTSVNYFWGWFTCFPSKFEKKYCKFAQNLRFFKEYKKLVC